MAEQEGVIKYRLDHQPDDAPDDATAFQALRAWRAVLHRLALVGQHPNRYIGYGYGNVSVRAGQGFLISGTQTGAPEQLPRTGYAQVLHCDIAANRIVARGPVKPSSEALTHGAVYAVDPAIGCVLHVHSPELWSSATAYPCTPAGVPYGTPAMAEAVARLYRETPLRDVGLFTMRGHEDGVVAFGVSPEQAGTRLVAALAETLASLESAPP